MSKKLIITASLLIVAGAVSYFLIERDSLMPPTKINIGLADQTCISDSDCVVISKNCDSCGAVLNRFSLPKYKKGEMKLCPDYAKISSCETRKPKCLSGACVLSLPEPQANLPFYTIRQINTVSLPAGTYNTEAQVYNIYECPPCPTGKFCATCLEPHVFLLQGKNIPVTNSYQIHDNQLIAFIHNPQELIRGSNYRFSIQIPKDYQFDETYDTSYKNNLKIVAYELISP